MNKGKMKTAKWVFFSMVLTLGMMPLLWLQQGCTGNYPPVTAYAHLPFTPTSTPTPIIITFDGMGSTVPSGWQSNNNAGTISIPALVMSSAQNQESSCSSGCYSLLAGPISFFAPNQAANIEYDFSTATNLPATSTISFYYYVDLPPSNQPYGQMYVQSGGTYGSSGFSLATGAWTQVSVPVTQSGVDHTAVTK